MPKDKTSKQCPNIERGETLYFSENPAPSETRNHTAGSDIDKAARSNHCVVSRSQNKGTHESIGCEKGPCYIMSPDSSFPLYIHHNFFKVGIIKMGGAIFYFTNNILNIYIYISIIHIFCK